MARYANDFYDIDIAEMLIYSNGLSAAQRTIIENYLSAKYNIPIAGDLYAGDNSENGDYDLGVIGIGQDATGNTHTTVAAGGLSITEQGSTLDLNDYLLVGYKVNNRLSKADVSNTPNLKARWARDWYADLSDADAGLRVDITFDIEDSGLSAPDLSSASAGGYKLLYRNNLTDAWTIATPLPNPTVDDVNHRISFANIPVGAVDNAYFTLGTTDQTNSPIANSAAQTWYSYQNGDWDDDQNWTLDGAALPSFENPHNEVPDQQDDVIITSGNHITISNDGKEVKSIEVIGDLDVATSTGHDLGVITGNGLILMSGDVSGKDNFPAGDLSGFADATDGGTVVLYGNGLSLDKEHTFNHLRVELTSGAQVATLLNNYTLNGELTVETGTFKINDNAQTTNLTMSVYGDVTINSTGLIRTGRGNARHQLNLYGDLINDGDIAFTNRTGFDYIREAGNGIVDVNFLNDAENQRIECNGLSKFYRIEIDKGISNTYELFITANNATNFELLGYADQGHPQAAQLTSNTNALGLLRGTVRVGNNVRIDRLNGGGNYNISESAQLWVDGGYVGKINGEAVVVYGTVRVSAGMWDAPIKSGFTLRESGTILVEGTGVLNANQIRTSVLGAGSLGGYIQKGGTANLLGGNINTNYYVFNLTYPGNVFTMTGGELNIKRSSGKGGIFINSSAENIEVTEGTVNLEIGSSNDMVITSRAPFYNVNMRNTVGNTHKIVLDEAVGVSSNIDRAAQPLVVLNNLTIEENTHFKTNGQNVTAGRNFTIQDNALYEFEDNTTIFNSNKNGTLYIGDITGLTNSSYTDPEANNPYLNWDHPFHHLTINKPEATLTFAAKSPGDTGDNDDIKTGAGGKNVFRNKSNLIKVIGDFTLEAGTLDIDRYSLRLYGGNITNKGALGIYTNGVSSTDAIVKFRKSGGDFIINTVTGSEFGNLRINSGDSKVTFTSDVFVERLEYRHGRVYIGTHNLKVNIFDINLEGGETQTSGSNRIFSTEDMFITAGNASDGGLSLYVSNPLPAAIRTYNEYTAGGNNTFNNVYNQPDELWFPIGTEANSNARYTPAIVNLSNVTDDGYITINPVDDILGTTNIDGSDLLSYYWRVRHSNFTALPTVTYQFAYDEDDVDASVNEANFVAGQVLSTTPYTRSGEDFEDSDGNGTLDAGEGAAELTSVDEGGNLITFNGPADNGFKLEEANYTAGQEDRFTGQVEVYYSRNAYDGYTSGAPNWRSAANWSTGSHEGPVATDYPKEGDVAIIGGSGDRRRPISIKNGTSVDAAQTVINRVQGDVRLYIENTATANLGVVEGDGTIQYYLTETNSPTVTGDFGAFANNYINQSRFLFYGDGGTNITLPTTPLVYPDVRIEGPGNRNFSFPVEVTVKGNMIVDNQATFRVASSILIEGDATFGGYQPGKLVFPTDGGAKIVSVKGNLITTNNEGGSGSISVDNAIPNNLEHRLVVEGNIEHRNGTIDLFSNNTGGNNVILELAGDRSRRFYKSVPDDPEFYRIVMDKGVNQDSTFTFEDEFTLEGPTSGATKALELQNGTLILNDPDIDINLTTGGDNFLIPSTAALEVRNGQVKVSGDNTGILLAGTLRITGNNAKVDMNNGGNGNNYIEYSVGNPTLEISAGTLTVGSQIRRVLNDDSGVLSYRQTGGSVTIGRAAAGSSIRGMLEVVNNGTFVHTGGELKIVRSNNSASIAALFLEPGTFDVSGSEIMLGDGNSPTNEVYGINSNIPLHRLTVNNASSKNPRALLFVRPLTVNNLLTITNGATLDAGLSNLTLTLDGDLINDGTYLPRENTTIFSSTAAQTVSGANPTDFYNLEKTNVGTLSLNQTILVAHDLHLLDGTVADNGNTIEVRGDVTHDAVHTSTGGEGIVFAGTSQQQLSRSVAGTSTFGVVTIRNDNGLKYNGVVIPEANGFNFTITERLRLDKGVLNIGSSSLTLEENASIEAVNPFEVKNMIRTNSSFADAGLKKVFSAGSATNFVFPVGEDVYSPVTVDFTSVGGSVGFSRGTIAVIPNRTYHPVVNDGIENTLSSDPNNVLQYYWAVRTKTLNNFTGNIVFTYDQSDVAVGTDMGGDPYQENEYIAARILSSSTSVDKFTAVDEPSNQVTFKFVGTNNNEVYGDYFCGIDLAIPAEVPVFTSTGNTSAYDNSTAWTISPNTVPFPVGGPQGSSVIVIKSGHTIDFNRNGIEVYKTEIEEGGTINLDATIQHNLGIVSGRGTLYTQTGTLPAGLYQDFFTCVGGKINYGGDASANYSVLKGGIASLREVTFSGSGQRTMPNTASITICEDMIIAGPTVTNSSANGTDNITVGNDFLIQSGVYRTGSKTMSVGNDLVVQGTYQGQTNHRNTVSGNVAINGGTFNAGNNSVIGIGGNLSYPSGTFTSGSSRIIMQGNSVQTITGTFTGATDMNRLEINNGAGVALGVSSAMTIDTELILRNGTFTPGVNKLLLDADATVGPDKRGNANSYVNGTLCKLIVNNGTNFTFPVGNGNRWGYASIDPTLNNTTTHEWCVEYFDASPETIGLANFSFNSSDADIKTVSHTEYWRIEDNATGVPARIGLMWDGDSDVSGESNDWYELKIMEWNGTAWDNKGGTGHATNPVASQNHGFFSATSDITFSEKFVTIGSTTENNALPVELLSFQATAKEQTVQLVWETASEINNDYFEVLRSVDGITFKKIGEVAGAGNSSKQLRYEFTDKLPLAGVAYYQLKQVDYNGMYDYSDKVSVEWISTGEYAAFIELNLYPNPAPQGKAKLRVTGLQPRSTATIKLLDMFGKVHLQQVIEADRLGQDGYLIQPRARLSAGVYVVSVQQGSRVHQKTLIIR